MNDNDIIKALELCKIDNFQCKICPLYYSPQCRWDLIKHSYDMINRQKAEIERLREEKNIFLRAYREFTEKMNDELKRQKAEAISPSGIRLNQRDETSRIEAVKEFAERLKKETKGLLGANFIDDLVKEMVGEEE